MRLCPEDEVLHLCYHTAVHHGLAHPHGYRDILGVLRVECDTLDWPTLIERARAWRVSVAVWVALSVARGRMQESRIKNQESRVKQPATSNESHATRNSHHASRITHHEAELIPESALDALRVPRWRQALLRPFVRRAVEGRAAMVSGTMRFLGVQLVDRAPTSAWATSAWGCDLPGVVLRAPTSAWACSPANAGCTFATIFPPGKPSGAASPLASFTYPLHVLARGLGALLRAVIRHS